MYASSTEGARSVPDRPAPLAAIPGCDGYFVQRDDASPLRGRVLSAPKRRMIGKGWRQLQPDTRGRVRLPVNGVYQWRSVRGLVREAFGGAGC